jgi:hypothetical protein
MSRQSNSLVSDQISQQNNSNIIKVNAKLLKFKKNVTYYYEFDPTNKHSVNEFNEFCRPSKADRQQKLMLTPAYMAKFLKSGNLQSELSYMAKFLPLQNEGLKYIVNNIIEIQNMIKKNNNNNIKFVDNNLLAKELVKNDKGLYTTIIISNNKNINNNMKKIAFSFNYEISMIDTSTKIMSTTLENNQQTVNNKITSSIQKQLLYKRACELTMMTFDNCSIFMDKYKNILQDNIINVYNDQYGEFFNDIINLNTLYINSFMASFIFTSSLTDDEYKLFETSNIVSDFCVRIIIDYGSCYTQSTK